MAIYDLELLKAEGWRVHIKNVKDKDYIVAQRTPPGQTKRVSKGLGRFNLDLWLQLEALGMTPQNVQKKPLYQDDNAAIMSMQQQIDDLQAQNKSEIKRLRKYVIRRLKVFRDEKKKLREELDEMHLFVGNVLDDIHIPDFSSSPALSAVSLKEKVLELEKRIDEYSILDLAGSVVCPKCDEKGLISIKIRCNACGVDMGIGWATSAM